MKEQMNISRCANELYRLIEGVDEQIEDCHAFGGYCVEHLVWDGIAKERDEILSSHGYTLASFERELSEVTTDKYAAEFTLLAHLL